MAEPPADASTRRFLRRYVPGFERGYVVQSGVNIGERETRRILGDYQLTADDILQARKFPDVIARSAYPWASGGGNLRAKCAAVQKELTRQGANLSPR